MPNFIGVLRGLFGVFFVEKQNIESMEFKKKAGGLAWRKTITNIK